MARAAQRLRRFYGELKRRHVLRVVLTYAAVAWLVMQIGETTFEAVGLPPGALTFVVVVSLLGFPIAAVLAWSLQVVREAPPTETPAPGAHAAVRDHAPIVLSNLPAPATPLVGREAELADAERLIRDGDARVVTILGSAGVGKTRLTLELGRRLAPSFPNGVCFAAVGRLGAPESLPFLLAERLGVGFASGEDPWAATLGFLREKRLLLIIDNFEQLVEASGALAEIVRGAPGVVLLVTSRERLELQGETVLRLQGLACPPPDANGTAADYDGVRLFVRSARRVDRTFELRSANAADVGRICRLVEGLPLALELAAACVGVLSPAEIAREIELRHDFPLGPARDAPPRHRSLRAAFESSWTLLDPRERQVFRRLSVFHGGFGRAEAETVAQADLPVLAALVNKSLLRHHDSGRFDMLEIVRQFGREKLGEDPGEERAVRELHAEQSVRVLEELVRRSDAGEVETAVAEAARDADNIRDGWAWAVDQRDTDRLGRAADGLFRLWESQGWIAEGRELFRRAVRAVEDPDSPQAGDPPRRTIEGRLLAREGAFAHLCGAYEQAGDLSERARTLLAGSDDPRELAFVLQSLSFVARARGDFEEGRSRARESLSLFERAGDNAGMAAALNSLGAHSYYLGEYEEAKRLYRDSIVRYRQAGDQIGALKPLNNLAGVAMADGDYEEARRLLRETLEQHRRRKNRLGASRVLGNLGLVAYTAGEHDEAEALLEEGIATSREVGAQETAAQGLTVLGNVRVARGDGVGALAAYRQAMDAATELRDLPLALTILVGLARLQRRDGEMEIAQRFLHLVRRHPAADEDTRREAGVLLEELGPGEAPPVAPGEAAPDAAAVRDLALAVLEGGTAAGRTTG
ncbi:MAG TPA: tetratricopeptide repeat protein [Longimicrobiales bacterium]|nr:tetratricopeptide repeat protein [Longimicrobiales bacterium]